MAHTPGPWRLSVAETWPFDVRVVDGADRRVVVLDMAHYSTRDKTLPDVLERDPEANGEVIANARLIAAAPDLLFQLRALVTAIDECFRLGIPAPSPRDLNNARTAIAEAEGR